MESGIIIQAFEEVKEEIKSLKKAMSESSQGGNSADLMKLEAQFVTLYAKIKKDDTNHNDAMLKAFQSLCIKVSDMRNESMRNIQELQKQQSKEVAQHKELPPQMVIHRVDFTSKRIVIGVIVSIIISLVATFYLMALLKENRKLSANDLKYRYIKMSGGAGGEFIMELDEFFRNKDNKAGIKNLRNKVEDYEETICQKVIAEERARLLEQESKQLNDRAKRIKNKN